MTDIREHQPALAEQVRLASFLAGARLTPLPTAPAARPLIGSKDAESGRERWVDTSNIHLQHAFRYYWQQHEERLRKLFLTTKVDRINIQIERPYIKPLVDFFKLRERRL